jgi:hypothetical protein
MLKKDQQILIVRLTAAQKKTTDVNSLSCQSGHAGAIYLRFAL